MFKRLDRAHRALPVVLGALTLVSVSVLFVWDADPSLFPSRAHDLLAAFPLALIAIAYLAYQTAHRPWRLPFFSGLQISFGRSCPRPRSSTTLPLDCLSSMCSW
jgi:hypothetical protein